MIDEAVAKRLLGVHEPPGQVQLHGDGPGQEALQLRASDPTDCPLDLRQPEFRVGSRDADVRITHHEDRRGPEAQAVDREDHRLFDVASTTL